MDVNNNLYFVVGNLDTELYIFQEEVIVYVCLVEKSVSLANSPYFPLSSIIPFVRLTIVLHIKSTLLAPVLFFFNISKLVCILKSNILLNIEKWNNLGYSAFQDAYSETCCEKI